jgi:hypothetical protein
MSESNFFRKITRPRSRSIDVVSIPVENSVAYSHNQLQGEEDQQQIHENNNSCQNNGLAEDVFNRDVYDQRPSEKSHNCHNERGSSQISLGDTHIEPPSPPQCRLYTISQLMLTVSN